MCVWLRSPQPWPGFDSAGLLVVVVVAGGGGAGGGGGDAGDGGGGGEVEVATGAGAGGGGGDSGGGGGAAGGGLGRATRGARAGVAERPLPRAGFACGFRLLTLEGVMSGRVATTRRSAGERASELGAIDGVVPATRSHA